MAMSDTAYNKGKSRRASIGAADFVMSDRALPELLAPAGSPRALEAAIEGGADAVYFGGLRHNARISAENFSPDTLPDYVKLAHAHGVKMYQTLNTLASDRELAEVVEDARIAYEAGVDALIVADTGVAAAIHRALPDFALHASTQASGHSVASAEQLAKLGFSRMVCAREMSLEDIRRFTASSPIEAEVFVHGALCVCHSGQCLFSSLVGGRSGNRGECAQPCRLPFRTEGDNKYPLSLKDLSLARHIPALIDAGVASLKIEGRMKSSEYVLAVTSVFRRLLDEYRPATRDEMDYLASIFSRGGFTDGYFTKNIGPHMLGVRSEQDKSITRSLPPFEGLTRSAALDFDAHIKRGQPMTLTISDGKRAVTVTGDIPEDAIKSPSEHSAVLRNLTKLGGTPYTVGSANLVLDDGLAIPVSKINALRRDALSKLSAEPRQKITELNLTPARPHGKSKSLRVARFTSPSQIPPEAQEYFDLIYLPLECYTSAADGVVLPPVIFDSERDAAAQLLRRAKDAGAEHALVGNLGHLSLVTEAGLIPHGDFRLNVTNTETVAQLEQLGLSDVVLSPELTLPQARDIKGDTGVMVYGRIPLMVLEKCICKDIADCAECKAGRVTLVDRMRVRFPVLREWQHRSVIYNSLPTYMADRTDRLDAAGITCRHFIFSTESASDVNDIIEAYQNCTAPKGTVRRI